MREDNSNAVKLKSRGQYAVMAMVELAHAKNNRPLPLSDIADNAGISLSYLEQLIAGMRRHQLVKSYRGPGGGYMLAKHPREIIITDILKAAEDSTPAKRNTLNGRKAQSCHHTYALWGHIGELLAVTLSKITLEDVLSERLENNPHTSKIFEIMAKSA